MTRTFAELLDSYLDGELAHDEAVAVERRLATIEGAAMLSDELSLRALLGDMGPEAPPAGLLERLEAVVLSDRRRRASDEGGGAQQVSALDALGAGLRGALWMFRGPALAWGASAATGRAASGAWKGLATVSYALGPLGLARSTEVRRTGVASRSRWKRLIALRR